MSQSSLSSQSNNRAGSPAQGGRACPSCLAENKAMAKFCRGCGRALAATAQATASAGGQELLCSQCQCPVRVTDRFCSVCGLRQPYRILANMKVCLGCNVQLPEKASYCHNCGNDVTAGSTSQVPVPVELFQEDDPDAFPVFEA